MSELSRPKNNKALRQTYQVDFSGLNHRKGATDGEIYDMENMTSTHYPVLSPRGKRYDIEWGEDDGNAYAFIVYEGKLIQTRKDGDDWYIDVNGTLFKFEGDIAEQNKLKFIIMNNRAILYPMGWYVNLKSLESLDTFDSVDEIDIEDPQENDIVTVVHTYAEGFVRDELYYWNGLKWEYLDDESGDFGSEVYSSAFLPVNGFLFESQAIANTIESTEEGFLGWDYYFKPGDGVKITGSKHRENDKYAVIKEIDGNTMRFYEDTFILDSLWKGTVEKYMPVNDEDDPMLMVSKTYKIKVFGYWYYFELSEVGMRERSGLDIGAKVKIDEYWNGNSQVGAEKIYMEVYDTGMDDDPPIIPCFRGTPDWKEQDEPDIVIQQEYIDTEEYSVLRYNVTETIEGIYTFNNKMTGDKRKDYYFGTGATHPLNPGSYIVYVEGDHSGPGGSSMATMYNWISARRTYVSSKTVVREGIQGSELDFEQIGGYLHLSRTIPEMDFVFTSNNRVWGGKGDTLYASKLGDGSNFNVFEGLSTDSYSVELSGSGDITGGIEYNGYPTFFKENSIHKLYGDNPSNYQLMTTMTQGVKKECGDSLAVAGEVLYYISKSGVMAYNGGAPVYIGDPIGRHLLYGIGSTDGRKYYLSATDGADAKLYVYDTYYRMWHIEDNKNFFAMCYDDVLYAGYIKDGAPGIITLSHDIAPAVDGDIEESDVEWFVQFADFVIGSPFKKGVAKMNIRLDTSGGGEGTVYIRFDHEAEWDEVATFGQGEKHSEILPIVPKRGDNFTIKIIGTGIVDIYGLTVQYYHGSEI